VIALVHLRSTPLSRDGFLWLKCAFAGTSGVLAALIAALTGLAPEAPVEDDPRWCSGPVPLAYPCDYVDKGGLAVTSRAHGCSGTPTWQLVVTGALEPAHVRVALGHLASRYPALTTRVQSLDGVPPLATRYRYAQDPSFSVDAIFTVDDLRGDPGGLTALEAELHDRHLDLFTDFPMTLTMAITSDASCRLFFRQHHAIADGRAFIEALSDFARFLEAARRGRRPDAAELAPVGRRSELEALGLSRARRVVWTFAGYGRLLRALVGGLVRPPALLIQNRSNDYTGPNGVVHWRVDDAALAGWERARERAGVSLNSLLAAVLFEANRRFHRARGVALGRVTGSFVMETRPRDASFRSFANHLATLEVDLRLDRLADLPSVARAIHAQIKRQRITHAPEKRLLCERQLVLAMTVEQMQRFVFETKRPAFNLNFSNLIALDFPPMGGEGWSVDEVRICTPVTPRTGIVLTVIRYRGRLCFNFNYKGSAVTRDDVERLRSAFADALSALDTGAGASSVREMSAG
jgi:hypothetical protein